MPSLPPFRTLLPLLVLSSAAACSTPSSPAARTAAATLPAVMSTRTVLAGSTSLDPGSQALSDQLAHIERFALGGVGYAGSISDGELAAAALVHRPDAITRFESLARSPNPAARLYALWGLAQIAPAQARSLRARLATDEAPVTTQQGCMVFESTVDDVMNQAMPIAP